MVCLPVLTMIFNFSFYGFVSTGCFFFLVFVSYCLLKKTKKKQLQEPESFCTIFESREATFSLSALCPFFSFNSFLFQFYFHVLGYVFFRM